MRYNYSRLLGRLKEKELTQQDLADAIGVHAATLSTKLKGKSEFTQDEMSKALSLLDIPMSEISTYFFVQYLR